MVGHMLIASSRIRLLLNNNSTRKNIYNAVWNASTSTIQTSLNQHKYTYARRYESSRGMDNSLSVEYEMDSNNEGKENNNQLSLPLLPSPTPPSPLTSWEKIKKRTGLTTLLPEWKLMLSKDNIMNDIAAGITVGCVAMPLSLAIALASGVSPEIGLVSAVVGGTVACLLGGAPLGVTGPSLATTVLLSGVAATHGMSALVFVTAATGALQVISGALRLGGLVRFVPQPVIAGFTAGVGGVMLFNQLPRMLGVVGPSAPGILEMVSHVATQLGNIHPASVVLSLGTLATVMLLPKVYPKVPASVVAVVGAATLNVVFGLGAPVIGSFPCNFPMPSMPALPDFETMYSLMGASLTLYGLTSLESLLSGSAADKIDKEDLRKHEPNVELVGQGLSNFAVSCFGGIPVTGAIARTSLNINAGAKTRRASMFHVGILGGAFALGPVVGLIPLSALSGILLSVAIRLLNPSDLKFLSKISYRELAPLAATFGTVMASDLVTGVEVGVATALAMQIFRRTTPKLLSTVNEEGVVKLAGDATFLSAGRIEKLQEELEAYPIREDLPLTLDFSGIITLDATAGETIVDMITILEATGHNPNTLQLVGINEENFRILSVCDARDTAAKFIKSN